MFYNYLKRDSEGYLFLTQNQSEAYFNKDIVFVELLTE